MKDTKANIETAKRMILTIVDRGSYQIQNETEHRIAEKLLAEGAVTVLKRKNYGHIDIIG